MDRAPDASGLKALVIPHRGVSRNMEFTHGILGRGLDNATVRGYQVMILLFKDGKWRIDNYSAGKDAEFGDMIGPFDTLEAAYLALQIIKD